jgi:hypothetical protein
LAHSEQLNSRRAAEENIAAQRRLHTAPIEDKT